MRASPVSGSTNLSLAQSLLTDIVSDVADKYSTDLEDYLSGNLIQTSLDGIDENISRIKEAKASEEDTLEGSNNIGKTRKKQIKENIEAYNNQMSLTYEYVSLSKELGRTSEQSYSLLLHKVDPLLYDIYSRNLLFNETIPTLSVSINFDHRVPALNVFRKFNGDDVITMTIPLKYYTTQETNLNTEEDSLYMLIEDFECQLANWNYEIQRPKDLTDIDNYYVVIKAYIKDPVETGVLNY